MKLAIRQFLFDNNKKRSTIRFGWREVETGAGILYVPKTENMKVIDICAYSYTKYKHLKREDALTAGYASLKEMKDSLAEGYPNLEKDSEITIIYFTEHQNKTEHRYLKENKVPLNVLPENYLREDDERKVSFKETKYKYGVDPRETWNLNDYFFVWFFERLCMYDKINIVATNTTAVMLRDKSTITMQNAIDRLKELCLYFIQYDEMETKALDKASNFGEKLAELREEYKKNYDEFMDLFQSTLLLLWW